MSSEDKEGGGEAVPSSNTVPKTESSTFLPRDPSYSAFISRQTQERKKLLEVAYKFLINPRVVNSSAEDKTAFLKKKGLNEEEIYWVTKEAATAANNGAIIPRPLPPPVLSPSPLVSRSYSWGQIVIRGIMVGTMVSLLVYWIKNMFAKWSRNQRLLIERQTALENQVRDMKTTLETTVSELKQSNLSIKTLIETQSRELTTRLSTMEGQSPSTVSEGTLQAINSEISTVKGLLLNRHQFPTPQKSTQSSSINSNSSSGIPSWQRSTQESNGSATSNGDTIISSPPFDVPVEATEDQDDTN